GPEPVCPGNARAVHQGIDRQCTFAVTRLFDPDLPEEGKFLAVSLRRIDAESPRGETEDLYRRKGAEEGSALKGEKRRHLIRIVYRGVDAKAGKARLRILGRRIQRFLEVEKR